MFVTTDSTETTCCDPEPADTANSLKSRLLNQIRSYPQQVTSPAKCFHIEVDGIFVGTLEKGQAFILPEDARSITLRDENRTARAHFLTEQNLQNVPFDQDRFSLTLKEKGGQKRLLVEVFSGQ